MAKTKVTKPIAKATVAAVAKAIIELPEKITSTQEIKDALGKAPPAARNKLAMPISLLIDGLVDKKG